MKILATVLAATVAFTFFAATGTAHASGPRDDQMGTMGVVSVKTVEFDKAMRKLWEDHITWTRLYIISAVSGLPDEQQAAERLLQNQTDIGNAVKSFYGEEAGNTLTALLKTHITTAGEIIAAAKSGDANKQESATKRWYENADQIAMFLSSANPKYWKADEMKSMMHNHLDLTTDEVVARLQHNWSADVNAYDNIHLQILNMADMLSKGIEAQFPAKF